MALQLKTSLFPYRLVLKRKEPVELKLELSNSSREGKFVSMAVSMPRYLSFDKGGLRHSDLRNIGTMFGGDSKKFVFDIFPAQAVKPSEVEIHVLVTEHYNNSFQYVANQLRKKITLIIE